MTNPRVARVSGSTLLAGVTGWPLGHTLSPAIHNAAYEAMGLDWLYVPLPVEHVRDLPRLAETLRVLPFVGINVTMPYKEAVMELCDEVDTVAELAGAVNTVRVTEGRIVGHNTDVGGLVEALAQEVGFTARGADVVVLGAGGAAAAALVAFVLEGAASVTVVNRTVSKAEAMIARIADRARGTAVAAVETGPDAGLAVAGSRLLVNATPLGMREGDPLPIPAEWLRDDLVVADMVYRPSVTPLMAAAELVGARVMGGLGMLVAQGAASIEIWNVDGSRRAPRDTMRAAAIAALEDQDL